jgi:ABC-type uncharacterized transport system substrate-binding protein
VLIALAVGALAVPLGSLAQQPGRIRRIGFLYFGTRQSALDTGRYAAFLEGMRELGYDEGQNFVVDARYADGVSERLPRLAQELARFEVAVIVASGTPSLRAAQQATSTLPIVAAVVADPVANGFAASLARPGRNITGLTTINIEALPKQVELLKIAVPELSRVAVLLNPANPAHPPQRQTLQVAAQKLGIRVLRVDARNPEDIERGFGAMVRERAGAAIILGDTFFVQQIPQIAELALQHRLPIVCNIRQYVQAGGFMSYGADDADNFRRAAAFVDKILKGAKPGDLPFEQPTRLYLTINGKTAKAIGLAIPRELLLRADKVIE